ncbi:hypothetical protein DM01DRAFT_1375387 [Hesseltinella vesiculosa]|uniref:Uncharacterized protein n=1 Tax=Hesseltinella vesiculosa TaxID=101127 RepID=A0A1X2GE23_9FUNG|nr:hypothetical protein DM01DRAFT_1375387 [Hesseltinella vesiculosa]
MPSHNVTRLDNASIEHFIARRRCWCLTCIRCQNSATRQRSPPSEAMINWDELDEFYGQFRHNAALPINLHLPDNFVDLPVGDIARHVIVHLCETSGFMFYLKLINDPSRRSAIAFYASCTSSSDSETMNPYSSDMKRQQYPQATNVSSFKIDFRIIFSHHHHHKHIDLVAGEAARGIDEQKLKLDHSKVTREAKEVLDRLILSSISGESPQKGIAIQLMGLQGEISAVHLDDSGLYVALPRARLSFPQSVASVKRFLPTLKALLTLRRDLESMAMLRPRSQYSA